VGRWACSSAATPKMNGLATFLVRFEEDLPQSGPIEPEALGRPLRHKSDDWLLTSVHVPVRFGFELA
jgi:hypothetical protein